ncbi:AMP-binding protein [Candidatus Kaiserbacteria bacterium]|nr:AMP-binding protein [Candidatus Kaiserbacteria bacterium]
MKTELRTITDLIESFDARRGDAIIYKNGFRTFRYSYPQLASLVRKCASLYQKHGIQAGDKIALWGPNRPEWVIAHLGAVYCGAVAVPIDIQALPEAAAKIVQHSEVRLIVKSALRKPYLTEVPTIILDDLEFDLDLPEAGPREAREDEPLDIVYTSGTTGDPKGVVLTHGNIMSNVRGIIEHLRVDERDSILSLLPISHMLGQTCGVLAPLAAGMSVVFLGSMTAGAMFAAFRQERITIVLAVPRILQGIRSGVESKLQSSGIGRMLSRLSVRTAGAPRTVKKICFFLIHRPFGSSLRFFVSGGAAIDAATVSFADRFGFKILQGYGLTECSPILTAERESEAGGKSAGVVIRDVELRIAPDGEILARGPNIFTEYYKDPDRTAETFREGWFLTGDFGELDAGGHLSIKGRKKETIVTPAGVNVYPDDVEPILNAVPGVKESCVVGIQRDDGEEVHAVVIPSDPAVPASEIMHAANGRLNSSQHIQSLSFWTGPEFPKTTTLKIKRGLVRESVREARKGHVAAAVAPSKLRGLISQVTRVPVEEIAENSRLYADLKLDSIGRIELSSLITQEYFFDFEEDHITETTNVGNLERIVASRAKLNSYFNFPGWPHWRIMAIARFLGMELINANIARFFIRETIRGKENLRGLHGPVIFAANHVSFGDHALIFRALPYRYRYMFASPAFAEFFFLDKSRPPWERAWKKFSYYYGAATMALFPTSEVYSSKRALEHTGGLIDSGESILIFPEAERTRTREMLPFRKGTAILLKNIRVPVVPIGHRGMEYIYPRDAAFPHFGKATVNIGKPITFGKESIEEITTRLQAEIEKLRHL